MRPALKLLILMAVIVTVAALCGGWKWAAKPKATKALAAYAIAPAGAADPLSSSIPDTSLNPDGWTWGED
jgi:hypothetical protein